MVHTLNFAKNFRQTMQKDNVLELIGRVWMPCHSTFFLASGPRLPHIATSQYFAYPTIASSLYYPTIAPSPSFFDITFYGHPSFPDSKKTFPTIAPSPLFFDITFNGYPSFPDSKRTFSEVEWFIDSCSHLWYVPLSASSRLEPPQSLTRMQALEQAALAERVMKVHSRESLTRISIRSNWFSETS